MTHWIKIIDADYNNTGAYAVYFKKALEFTDPDGTPYWHYSYDDPTENFFPEEPGNIVKTVYLHFD